MQTISTTTTIPPPPHQHPHPHPHSPQHKPITNPSNPDHHIWKNGLELHTNFITPEEESEIIKAILADGRWIGIARRQTLHYGVHFDYSTFGASEEEWTEVPGWVRLLVGRLPGGEGQGEGVAKERGKVDESRKLDQFTVQYYPPGTGIPPHVDTHSVFGEDLWSLSLGCGVPMGFKRCGGKEARKMRMPKRCLVGDEGGKEEEGVGVDAGEGKTVGVVNSEEKEKAEAEAENFEVWLEERSLLCMRGDARYGFTHGIRGRKYDERVTDDVKSVSGKRKGMSDEDNGVSEDGKDENNEEKQTIRIKREGRWSITMRSVRRGEEIGCECKFPGVCDARFREEREREKAAEKSKAERKTDIMSR